MMKTFVQKLTSHKNFGPIVLQCTATMEPAGAVAWSLHVGNSRVGLGEGEK